MAKTFRIPDFGWRLLIIIQLRLKKEINELGILYEQAELHFNFISKSVFVACASANAIK